MNDTKKIEAWRAEEIAKVFLLNSGLVSLLPDYENNHDFVAISKKRPDKKIIIEVKATKYPKSELKKAFIKTRNQLSHSTLPALLMYINYDNENGYFESFKNVQCENNHEIQVLQTDKFKEGLEELIA
jgi:hypothetical protein